MPQEKTIVPTTILQNTTTPTSTLSDSPECRQENKSLFIDLNPIPYHHLGDSITFNGTTNLPTGEKLTLWVGQEPYHTCPKMPAGTCNDSARPCCDGVSRTVTANSGYCDINSWSLALNTSQHDFRQDSSYVVQITGINSRVRNASNFSSCQQTVTGHRNIPSSI